MDNDPNGSTNPFSYDNPIFVPVPKANPSTVNTIPQAGDIISFSANHTGVVVSANVVRSRNGTLKELEQDVSSNGIVTLNSEGMQMYPLGTPTKYKGLITTQR